MLVSIWITDRLQIVIIMFTKFQFLTTSSKGFVMRSNLCLQFTDSALRFVCQFCRNILCEDLTLQGFDCVLKAVRQVAYSEGDYTLLTPNWEQAGSALCQHLKLRLQQSGSTNNPACQW